MAKLDWFSIDIIKKYNKDFDPAELWPSEVYDEMTLTDHLPEMQDMIDRASLMEVVEFVNTVLSNKINSENGKNL